MSSKSSNSNDTINETIQKYIETKEKLSELEKKADKYRDYIEYYMKKDMLSEITYSNHIIKKYTITRETISKKDVPQHIWDEYHKTSTSTMIRILKKNDKNNDKKEKKIYDSE